MKTEEMFPAESVSMDSPRLLWMKKHRVLTYFLTSTEEWIAGFIHSGDYAKLCADRHEAAQWFADETAFNGDGQIGIGDTENDAIGELLKTRYARHHGIKLWNEENQ